MTNATNVADSDISDALNTARFSPFHLKAIWTSSMGFQSRHCRGAEARGQGH